MLTALSRLKDNSGTSELIDLLLEVLSLHAVGTRPKKVVSMLAEISELRDQAAKKLSYWGSILPSQPALNQGKFFKLIHDNI